MCKNGPDIRAHLFRCQHQSAIAISASVVQSMEQEPIPEELYQNSIISHQQLLDIKHCIINLIQRTTLTRIGLFNQNERAELLNLFIPNPNLPTGIDFIDVTPKQCLLIHQYLKTLVTISTSATRSLIKLRNETLYKNTKYVNLQPQNKKTATSRNRYTALDPIEQELPEPRVYRIQYDFPPQELLSHRFPLCLLNKY